MCLLLRAWSLPTLISYFGNIHYVMHRRQPARYINFSLFWCDGIFRLWGQCHACWCSGSHYSDVIKMASWITSLTTVYSTVHSADKKYQSSASLAFVRGIHRWPVNSPHKWPVTRKMFPSDDVIMHRQWFSRHGIGCETDNMYCYSRVNVIYLDQAKSKMRFKMWIYP